MTEPLPDVRPCKCLPFGEHFRRTMHGEAVPRCELHGTLGSADQAPDAAEPVALNSEALENALAASLGAAVEKGRPDHLHDNQPNI